MARLLVTTCAGAASASASSPAAGAAPVATTGAPLAAGFGNTLRGLQARVARGEVDGVFAGVWGALFAQGIAPGSADECASVLRPPLRITPAERELLAATAELHDSALRAPLVPSKSDLSSLLGTVLR